jgi:hypothetical protein
MKGPVSFVFKEMEEMGQYCWFLFTDTFNLYRVECRGRGAVAVAVWGF